MASQCILKNSRVRFDLERVPFGQTHFWVRLIRNLGQTDTKSESKNVFLTRIPGQSDLVFWSVLPKNGFGIKGPFPGQI